MRKNTYPSNLFNDVLRSCKYSLAWSGFLVSNGGKNASDLETFISIFNSFYKNYASEKLHLHITSVSI